MLVPKVAGGCRLETLRHVYFTAAVGKCVMMTNVEERSEPERPRPAVGLSLAVRGTHQQPP